MHSTPGNDSQPAEPEWPVLDRYLAGHATSDDHAAVERWLARHPRATREILALKAGMGPGVWSIWSGPSRQEKPDQVAAVVTRVLGAQDDAGNRGSTSPGSRRAPMWNAKRPAIKIAAGLTLGLAAGVLAYGAFSSPFASHSERSVQYTTTQGQSETITLVDGSSMTLAPLTTARYVEAQNGTRQVYLVGHAQFAVRHSRQKPFTIHTGAVTTRVLGTSFDVRHYPGDSIVHVSVTDGKVSVQNTRQEVTLVGGDIGEISDSSTRVAPASDVGSRMSWTASQLSFDRVPLRTVLATLSRWHGYQFKIADTVLAQSKITAVFDITKPSETLGALGDLLEAGYTMHGDTITLYVKKSRAPQLRTPQWSSPSREIGK